MSTAKLEDIYNFVKLSDSIATAGQPAESQFDAIKAAGYEVVVNLALPTSTNALPNEQQLVEAQGMEYVHIPVIWENPTSEDFDQFSNVLNANRNRKVFVHCAMNMRVSAFMYLYRKIYQNADDTEARQDVEKIWSPNPTWKTFIEQMKQQHSA